MHHPACIALLLATAPVAAQNITFNFTNGTTATYPLSEVRNITFTGDVMNLNRVDASTVSWNASTIGHYQYQEPVRVACRLFLEGPYDPLTGWMNDGLRTSGLVPNMEPYTAVGYPHIGGGGGETLGPTVLGTSGANAIVDWVVLELRSSVTPGTVLASRSALLQRDGDVVDVDGLSPVTFNVANGLYYLAIRHRNHLGAMTGSAVPLSGSSAVVDFTSNALATYGTDARKSSGAVRLLWAGDVNFDHAVRYTGSGNDRDPILVKVGSTTPNNSSGGYQREDVNMNGTTKYVGADNDRDPILQNVGSTTPNNTRTEQLP